MADDYVSDDDRILILAGEMKSGGKTSLEIPGLIAIARDNAERLVLEHEAAIKRIAAVLVRDRSIIGHFNVRSLFDGRGEVI